MAGMIRIGCRKALLLSGLVLGILAFWACSDVSVLSALKAVQAQALIPQPQWAQSLIAGTGDTFLNGAAADPSGNVYVVGEFEVAKGPYGFGNNVTATGAGGYSDLLVKYNSSGQAQWAQAIAAGAGPAGFTGAAVDAAGNVYAVGFISGTGIYSFGNSVTAQGSVANNPVLVKYNSSGQAQWAMTTSGGTTGGNGNRFCAVSLDSSGNIYVTGYVDNKGPYTFATGVTASGPGTSNPLIVQYNSSGTAQWARSVVSGSTASYWFQYLGVATDSYGGIYAVGEIPDAGTYGFGGNTTPLTGTSSAGNVLLVKYNSVGVALLAETLTQGTGNSSFNGISVDAGGNIYAAGSAGSGVYGFGNGVSASGGSGGNVLLVKYNAAGKAQWATMSTAGTAGLSAIATDSSGNVYATGSCVGTCGFGNGVSANGSSATGNVLLVKCSSSGQAQWAQTLTSGGGTANFSGVALDSSNNIYAAGTFHGVGPYGFGNGVTATGTSTVSNILVVKY